ncbi:MAG TPA: hypothetical protein PLN52_19710, partial [Opitutaceae bacterium]|nr:hypothetical protein [Opitutaceae bacterium]
ESEWRRAGLDRLSVDEIGVIEAALIRHQRLTTPTLQIEVNQARQQSTAAASPITTASAADHNRTLLQRFGLPFVDSVDWKSIPPLKAKVVSWEGGNRFKLDNGQIWEGTEPITYALPG